MTKKLDLYKCNICGNVVEVVLVGDGTLSCCGENMEKIIPNTLDSVNEKHVPVVEIVDDKKIIKVGQILHPMFDEHYIQFIEAISLDEKFVKRKYLMPKDEPIMELKCDCPEIKARELCNVHGLFMN